MLVSDVIEPGITVDSDTPLETLLARRDDSKAWPVTNNGQIVGLLTRDALRTAPHGASAGQVSLSAYPYVHPDHPLSLALERMGNARVDMVLVVSRANLSQLIGVVTLSSVLSAYGFGIALPDSSEAL